MKVKVITSDYSLGGRLRARLQSTDDAWVSGHIITPHSMVIVRASRDEDPHLNYTIFELAHKGRIYTRQHMQGLSDRAISAYARKFAREVCG